MEWKRWVKHSEKKLRCFIFANFDNFATFVDRAVFTFIKDWSEGFLNMVLSTEYSEAVNTRYTFQPLWVSGITRSSFYTRSAVHVSCWPPREHTVASLQSGWTRSWYPCLSMTLPSMTYSFSPTSVMRWKSMSTTFWCGMMFLHSSLQ